MNNKRIKFKEMLNEKKIIIAPGAYDVLSAKLIEAEGFDTVYLTGAGASASLLGSPDIGLITLNEIVNLASNIDNAINLPVIADAESGFGNKMNVIRTVKEYEKSGVVAIHIEDKDTSMEDHVEKIKVAVKAKTDKNFMIIARTDARDRYGIDEAIRRGNAYLNAGAEIIFIHRPKTMKELELIPRKVNALNIINYSNIIEEGIRPLPKISELQEMGFKIAIFPSIPLFAAIKSVRNILKSLKESDKIEGLIDSLISLDEFKNIMEKNAL